MISPIAWLKNVLIPFGTAAISRSRRRAENWRRLDHQPFTLDTFKTLLMIYALNADQQKIPPSPSARATCPECASPVVAHCGPKIAWHWAHEHLACDTTWHEAETDWHRQWKAWWPPACVEVVIERDGQRHRADVRTPGGLVIEFQHSPLTQEAVWRREHFYGWMMWVFDAREAFTSGALTFTAIRAAGRSRPATMRRYAYQWPAWARRTWGQATAPVYWHVSSRGPRQLFEVTQARGGVGEGRFVSLAWFINRNGGAIDPALEVEPVY